jgi:hypothetical protein
MKMSAIEIRALTNKDKKNNMNSYNQSAVMPVLIANNIFKVTARNISKLPVVDGDNNEINKELIKPFLRGLKCNPQSYDFIVNLIQNIKDNGDVKRRIENRHDGYLTCEITLEDFEEFLKHCNGSDIRQTIRRRLINNLSSEFIISETKKEIVQFRPYDIYEKRIDKKSGKWTAKIMFAESIFGGLITGDHRPEGYVRIPRYLFPNVTHADKHHLESYNPIYRAIVYANTKNRYCKRKFYAKLPEFLESVFPEYLNKNNSLKVGLDKCEYSLNKALETLDKKVIKGTLLLNHLSFDKKEGKAFLNYRIPRSA